jgi:hypothetical protein
MGYFTQALGVGAGAGADYHHHIIFQGHGPYFRLADSGRPADGIEELQLADILFYHIDYFQDILGVLGGLHNDHGLFQFLQPAMRHRVHAVNNDRLFLQLPDNAMHFVVVPVADYNNGIPLLLHLPGNIMDALHHGAGGVNNPVAPLPGLSNDRRGGAVGAQQQYFFGSLSQTFYAPDASLLNLFNHILIVHDIPEHADFLIFSGGFHGKCYGAPHPETETPVTGNIYYHNLSPMKLSALSVTRGSGFVARGL